jgi:uncharacterized membrane protein
MSAPSFGRDGKIIPSYFTALIAHSREPFADHRKCRRKLLVPLTFPTQSDSDCRRALFLGACTGAFDLKEFHMPTFSRCKKAGMVAMLLIGTAPALARANYVQAQPIYARNNTDRPIWVAAYYVPAGAHNFFSDGWWKVDPGQCRLLLYNNGVNIYFYAHDDNGWEWEGNDATAIVQGETLHMFHRDTGPCYDPWTVTFE